MPANSVLILSALDPCGGAGVIADIETINQFEVTPLAIITALSVQNTAVVKDLTEISSKIIIKQFEYLKKDINFSVIKIGLLSSKKQINFLAAMLSDTNATIVLDPIIKSSTNNQLINKQAIQALKLKLLPLAYILTPNLNELQMLYPNKNEQQAINSIPCEWVLLTTTDVSKKLIQHRLYHNKKLIKRFFYKKLNNNYHGSGCTLASAISALLALKTATDKACLLALDYTYQTILNAKKVGKMQYHPNRQKYK